MWTDHLQSRSKVFIRHPRLLLFFIILLALIPRLFLLPIMGHESDLNRHYKISQYIIEHGIFKMYESPVYIVNHPPIGVGLYAGSTWVWHVLAGGNIKDPFDPSDSGQIATLSAAGLLFELALIALIFEIMLYEANVVWATATALLFAFSPGHLEAINGMGQTDSIYTFGLVLTLFLIRRHRPHWAWAAYAVAWLSKFQSIMILPIMIVWTWRRHGARTLMLNLIAFAVIIGAVMTPFVVNSGKSALAPYIQGAVNQQPYITNGSYNLWYWVSGATTSTRVLDSTGLVWGISYFEAALILFSLVTGLICLRVWLLPERDDEYLVAAAAGIAFFVLPTQIHSRYIYAGLVFLVLALRQAPWLFPVYLGFTFNFGQNVLDTMARGSDQIAFSTATLPWDDALNAITNTLLFVLVLTYALWPLWTLRIELPQRARDSLRMNDLADWGATLLLASLAVLSISLVPAKPARTIESLLEWLVSSVPPNDRILVPEASELVTQYGMTNGRWQPTDVTHLDPEQWANIGAAYLVLTDSDLNASEDLRAYVRDLLLLKYIAPENPRGPDAISFYRLKLPGTMTDLVFDQQIRLVGYDLAVSPGSVIHFRPYWQAVNTPIKDYSMFVHLYPPDHDVIIVQGDSRPGYANRGTLTWIDPTETLIGTNITLPLPRDSAFETYRLAIGIYDWKTGKRLVTDEGDEYLTIPVSFD